MYSVGSARVPFHWEGDRMVKPEMRDLCVSQRGEAMIIAGSELRFDLNSVNGRVLSKL